MNIKPSYIIIFVILLIISICVGNIIYCTWHIDNTEYTFTNTKSKASVKFVALSDLHDMEFGENNERLVKLVQEQKPDFIAVLGDMMTRDTGNINIMKTLLAQLADIAPTYCVLGNHERGMLDIYDYQSEIDSTGARLLDNESIIFEKDGQKLLIGGLTDYMYYEFNAPDYDVPERYLWDELNEGGKDLYTILLHHQPEYISSNLSESRIDLTVCGHTHGGLVRIPFIGGAYAPNQGWFPEYTKGLYSFGKPQMVITGGLGTGTEVPRLNNSAEICTITIAPQK